MRKDPPKPTASRTQTLLRKLESLPKRVLTQPTPEDVHQLRTTIRRFETLSATGPAEKTDGFGKLLKQLRRIRRRAGKLRDIDVQAAALRTVRAGNKRDRNELKQFLQQVHDDCARKLVRTIKGELDDGLEKRLRHAATAFSEPADTVRPGALAAALGKFASLAEHYPPLNEENLHDFRMDCKRIRYEAEMEPASLTAKRTLKQFKRIQDAIGEWHDWVNLAQSAEKVAATEHSPLLSAIRAVRQAKFNEALRISAEARGLLLELQASLPPAEAAPVAPPAASEPPGAN